MHKRHFIITLAIILGVIFISLWFFWKNWEGKVKSENGFVSVLILGKGGKGHSAPDLTDTMILASFSLKEEKINLISIPRDLWIPEIRAKVNSAYFWGKEKPEFGGGLNFAKTNVEKITGVAVNYALILDFSAFREIIDVLGGVNVTVEKAFTDTKFPIIGRENDLCDNDPELKCRYETLHFDQGEQIMNGETALKFVRSRNGDNGENTDLAREARQQKVISAIKSRILSPDIYLNPVKLFNLWRVVKGSIETDLSFPEAAVLGKTFLFWKGEIASLVFPENFLTVSQNNKKYDYQYVFLSKSGNWEEIQNWIRAALFKN